MRYYIKVNDEEYVIDIDHDDITLSGRLTAQAHHHIVYLEVQRIQEGNTHKAQHKKQHRNA